MYYKYKSALFLLFVLTSSIAMSCTKTNLTPNKIKNINATITDSSMECAIITNSSINTDVVDLISETIEMLIVLQDNDLYGEISWFNAMSIDSAIETLNKFLVNPEELNVETIVSYDLKMRKYFETYIIDDLNGLGMKMYNIFIERQKYIIEKSILYARNLIDYNINQTKPKPKQNSRF